MKKEIDKGFRDQLPETGHILIGELYPRLDELKKNTAKNSSIRFAWLDEIVDGLGRETGDESAVLSFTVRRKSLKLNHIPKDLRA